MKKLALVIGFLFLATAASAQISEIAGYSWNAPTGGSPVDFYRVELSQDSGAFFAVAEVDTNYYEFEAFGLVDYVLRVIPVDVLGRDGDSSPLSDNLYIDYGPPGPPSKPVRVQ